MRRLALTTVCWLFAAIASAATLDGPREVEVGMPAVFTMKGVPQENLKDFNWQVFNRPADAMILDLADRQGNPVLMFWSKTKCKCAVICDVNIPGAFQLILHEFTVGESNPGPDPKPKPDPDKKATWGVIIEERDDRDDLGPQRAMIMENQEVRKLFKAGQFQCRDDDVVDESGKEPPPDVKPYIGRARQLGLPALFLVADDGTVVWEGSVPPDVPATIKLISGYMK